MEKMAMEKMATVKQQEPQSRPKTGEPNTGVGRYSIRGIPSARSEDSLGGTRAGEMGETQRSNVASQGSDGTADGTADGSAFSRFLLRKSKKNHPCSAGRIEVVSSTAGVSGIIKGGAGDEIRDVQLIWLKTLLPAHAHAHRAPGVLHLIWCQAQGSSSVTYNCEQLECLRGQRWGARSSKCGF
jgi:hypothetical protein